MNIGIITTTYNRRKLLKRLYNSLVNQTDQNFTWVVIDDGSSDDTGEYIQDLNSIFEIRYFSKANGGKSKALNYAFVNNEDLDLFVIVDSDDYLLENAVSVFTNYAEKYGKDDEVGALFFRYQYETGELLGANKNTFQNDEKLSRIEHDVKYDKIDGCIAYFSKSIMKYRYPEFKDEKYVGPTVIQMMMSDEYKIVFSNEKVGVAEYQDGGLTSSGRKIRLESPKSMLVYCHFMQDPSFNFVTRIKYGIMANAYKEFIIGDTESIEKYRAPSILMPLGKLLASSWKNKHL